MRVLAIESSCDETAAAIYDSQQGLLSHALHSQVDIHREYGGVVPELASRDHIRKVLPLVQQALDEAGSGRDDIDAIAYTAGPGLVGALLVGACFARSLAWGWGVPSLGVHHLEAHLLAPMLEPEPPSYPFVALIVSGGHTLLVEVTALGEYKLLGDTLDDAVGEAFDKTAKLLGLGYPGGAALAKLAESGDIKRFDFPRPMVNRPGCDFSFSGLKTFAMNQWRGSDQSDQTRADIAAAFQLAVVDTLVIKAKRAMHQTQMSQLVVAGGVSANTLLRQRLQHAMRDLHVDVFFPRLEFCTDNAAMVAYSGCQRLLRGEHDPLSIQVHARWPFA